MNGTPHPSPLRIVVMGTGPFAVPLLQALLAGPDPVVALVTQPPRETRRGQNPPANPMRLAGEAAGLPLFTPVSINTDEARRALSDWKPDLFVVADYGQILAPETLAVAPLGGINLHGSLLPRYRGAAPIAWAIYHGDAETGVTVIHMTPQVDAGPCIAQARVAIHPRETAGELEARLAILGAPLIVETVARLKAGPVEALPQVASLACGARRLRKSDGEIDWQRSAIEIDRQVRAFEPWPRSSTCWLRPESPPLRLILGEVEPLEGGENARPGTILTAGGPEGLTVSTGQGSLRLLRVQIVGKRMLDTAELLRGYPLREGDCLGPEVR